MTKTIDEMLAELPSKVPEARPVGYHGARPGAVDEWEACKPHFQLNRALAELALLKAAAEKRQHYGHAHCCAAVLVVGLCTCGYDDMRKVLERLK